MNALAGLPVSVVVTTGPAVDRDSVERILADYSFKREAERIGASIPNHHGAQAAADILLTSSTSSGSEAPSASRAMERAIRFHTRGAQGGTIRNVNIEEWWPKLEPATREWLVANNGDVIPADTVGELTNAGRSASTEQLGDDEVDWIEAFANDEEPGE